MGGGPVGAVTPAAVAFVLRADDEVNALLGAAPQGRVLRQAVAFAHGNGGQAVRVHGAAEKPGLGVLLLHEELDAPVDVLVIGILGGGLVGLAGGEERQQAHGGGGGRVGVVGARERPAAVAELLLDEPLQSLGDGGFGLGRAAPFTDDLVAGRGGAAEEG